MTGNTPRYDRSVELYAEACEVMAGGVNSNFRLGTQPAPLFFDRGEGPYLYDADGNRYVDYVLGMGPSILGHAPAEVNRAVLDAVPRGVLFAGQHEDEVDLARLFCEMVPCADQVRLGSSGSEMDQAAIRVARAATGRKLVVKFEGHYHGWFDTVLVSIHPPLDIAGPEDAPVPFLPSAGQSAAAAQDIAILPWNDLAVLERFLSQRAADVASVIMEPILCNTCVVPPAPGYLEGVRSLCDRYDVVLIFDEVITGFRVAPGGAQQLLGVTPDLAVYAKALGGGYPIAAVAGKRSLMDLLGNATVLHGGSYNSNTISTAAALATLRVLARGDGAVYRQMEAQGKRLIEGLRELGRRAELPFHVQGFPAAFNTAFFADENDAGGDITGYRDYARRTDPAMLRRFLKALQDHGVRVTSRGTWFMATVHDDAQIEETLAGAEAALAELTS
jgi:glutamate-1-semialdehyde 2,1-aminomutase